MKAVDKIEKMQVAKPKTVKKTVTKKPTTVKNEIKLTATDTVIKLIKKAKN